MWAWKLHELARGAILNLVLLTQSNSGFGCALTSLKIHPEDITACAHLPTEPA